MISPFLLPLIHGCAAKYSKNGQLVGDLKVAIYALPDSDGIQAGRRDGPLAKYLTRPLSDDPEPVVLFSFNADDGAHAAFLRSSAEFKSTPNPTHDQHAAAFKTSVMGARCMMYLEENCAQVEADEEHNREESRIASWQDCHKLIREFQDQECGAGINVRRSLGGRGEVQENKREPRGSGKKRDAATRADETRTVGERRTFKACNRRSREQRITLPETNFKKISLLNADELESLKNPAHLRATGSWSSGEPILELVHVGIDLRGFLHRPTQTYTQSYQGRSVQVWQANWSSFNLFSKKLDSVSMKVGANHVVACTGLGRAEGLIKFSGKNGGNMSPTVNTPRNNPGDRIKAVNMCLDSSVGVFRETTQTYGTAARTFEDIRLASPPEESRSENDSRHNPDSHPECEPDAAHAIGGAGLRARNRVFVLGTDAHDVRGWTRSSAVEWGRVGNTRTALEHTSTLGGAAARTIRAHLDAARPHPAPGPVAHEILPCRDTRIPGRSRARLIQAVRASHIHHAEYVHPHWSPEPVHDAYMDTFMRAAIHAETDTSCATAHTRVYIPAVGAQLICVRMRSTSARLGAYIRTRRTGPRTRTPAVNAGIHTTLHIATDSDDRTTEESEHEHQSASARRAHSNWRLHQWQRGNDGDGDGEAESGTYPKLSRLRAPRRMSPPLSRKRKAQTHLDTRTLRPPIALPCSGGCIGPSQVGSPDKLACEFLQSPVVVVNEERRVRVGGEVALADEMIAQSRPQGGSDLGDARPVMSSPDWRRPD
ncbi:hypothetical protein B0H17DRAFT_1190023 [Mycena rosella]|uniref:Uncharacterized protein n=1 Tax=Mycena rosella TaxID=1033263 RepID=A0AAD7AX52_MYCRO|nr:hypothetical protein B0H17DRAFT_1190023 [Mycena rosella]